MEKKGIIIFLVVAVVICLAIIGALALFLLKGHSTENPAEPIQTTDQDYERRIAQPQYSQPQAEATQNQDGVFLSDVKMNAQSSYGDCLHYITGIVNNEGKNTYTSLTFRFYYLNDDVPVADYDLKLDYSREPLRPNYKREFQTSNLVIPSTWMDGKGLIERLGCRVNLVSDTISSVYMRWELFSAR